VENKRRNKLPGQKTILHSRSVTERKASREIWRQRTDRRRKDSTNTWIGEKKYTKN
jgi:hypothetical protein